ncbi:hypothetical protein [Kushneria marisflavi]|uniref:hypothetical protein n=1 Tax=Kushneria marisflavi TaxID=157779 RepID=UPI0011C3A0EB|nr:hypothetical protein [Kushneria marisflavi]
MLLSIMRKRASPVMAKPSFKNRQARNNSGAPLLGKNDGFLVRHLPEGGISRGCSMRLRSLSRKACSNQITKLITGDDNAFRAGLTLPDHINDRMLSRLIDTNNAPLPLPTCIPQR